MGLNRVIMYKMSPLTVYIYIVTMDTTRSFLETHPVGFNLYFSYSYS